MKNQIFVLSLSIAMIVSIFAFNTPSPSYEYMAFTTIESIVPGGLGRSRLITANETKDFSQYTSSQSEESNKRNKSDRVDIRVKSFDETKLLNFYNVGGIRFQNIAANDAIVSSKINSMIAEGWELAFVTSAVESKGAKDDNTGIFITRYIFKR